MTHRFGFGYIPTFDFYFWARTNGARILCNGNIELPVQIIE